MHYVEKHTNSVQYTNTQRLYVLHGVNKEVVYYTGEHTGFITLQGKTQVVCTTKGNTQVVCTTQSNTELVYNTQGKTR